MPELTPPPSINDARTQALMQLLERLAALDLTPLLVYRLDSVPAAAMPFLAWQFDILSPFWQLVASAATDIDSLTDIDTLADIDTLSGPDVTPRAIAITSDAERELLKSAIPLHRTRGTPFAIKRALAALGWQSVALLEGQDRWGANQYPASEGWAVFRVIIELAEGQPVTAGAANPIIAAVNFFKPARAWLDSVWFAISAIQDGAPVPRDRVTVTGVASFQMDTAALPGDGVFHAATAAAPLTDAYAPVAPLYNAHYRHSGITYGANEPLVADSALILNGAAVLLGG